MATKVNHSRWERLLVDREDQTWKAIEQNLSYPKRLKSVWYKTFGFDGLEDAQRIGGFDLDGTGIPIPLSQYFFGFPMYDKNGIHLRDREKIKAFGIYFGTLKFIWRPLQSISKVIVEVPFRWFEESVHHVNIRFSKKPLEVYSKPVKRLYKGLSCVTIPTYYCLKGIRTVITALTSPIAVPIAIFRKIGDKISGKVEGSSVENKGGLKTTGGSRDGKNPYHILPGRTDSSNVSVSPEQSSTGKCSLFGGKSEQTTSSATKRDRSTGTHRRQPSVYSDL